MEWQIIVAFVVVVSIILFLVAFAWYLNISGIYYVIKEARVKRVAHKKDIIETVKAN